MNAEVKELLNAFVQNVQECESACEQADKNKEIVIILEETKCSFNAYDNRGALLYHIEAEIVIKDGIGRQARISVDRPINGEIVFYEEFDGSLLLSNIVGDWLHKKTGIHAPTLEKTNLKEVPTEVSTEEVVTFFPDASL